VANATLGTWTSGGGGISWTISSLSPGQSAHIAIQVTPTKEGTITNTASATCNQTETNTANNSATQTTRVTVGTVYTVNSSADTDDGACAAVGTGNGCTLREAINAANVNANKDTILFNIDSGPQTITPGSSLPSLTTPVYLDATSQPGFAGQPIIEISGATAGTCLYIPVSGGGSTIRGLVINRCNGHGISIDGSNNVIQGNYIGTNLNGTAAATLLYSSIIMSGSTNLIGGTTPANRNVLSGNSHQGVSMTGSNNTIQGNYIGTNATGTAAIGGGSFFISAGASNNLIGGTTGTTPRGSCTGACNLISGNNGSVSINTNNSGATNNTIQGNFIGLNVSGTAAIPNNGQGVLLMGVSGNHILGNVISGNTNSGISLFFTDPAHPVPTTNNDIRGNFIGTNSAGTAAIPNSNGGVEFHGGASGNIIGGTVAADRNLISGNNGSGVSLGNFNGASNNNLVYGNYLGTNAAGDARLPNTGDGLSLNGVSGNQVGGTLAGQGNLISGNNNRGITLGTASPGGGLPGVPADGNSVQGNLIGTNAAGTAIVKNTLAGISLNGANNNLIGGTTGGARNVICGNGGNGGINLSNNGAGTAGSSGNRIQGNFIGTDITGTFALGNNNGIALSGNSSNNQIGGDDAADGATDGVVRARNLISGNLNDGINIGNFNGQSNGNIVQGNYIGVNLSGTAAIPNSFSGISALGVNATQIGGTTAGAGNLISGNNQSGISLNEAGPGSGQANLPVTNTHIEGNFIGTNSAGTAALRNQQFGVNISGVNSSNNYVGGSAPGARNLIGASGFNAVSLNVRADGNFVLGNWMGVDIGGNIALVTNVGGTNLFGNGSGIVISGSSNNQIGGTTPAERNVIAGNNCQGINIINTLSSGTLVQSSGNKVQGNYIGLNATGTDMVIDPTGGPKFGNKCSGVFLAGTTNNLIGGTVPGAGNVIGGSAHQGVVISNNNNVIGSGNTIQGNIIGSNVAMNLPLPSSIGIFLINGSSNNLIGGDDATDGTVDGVVNAGNKIFASSGDGINIQSAFINGANAIARGNTVQGNLIGGSTLLRNGNNGVNLTGAKNNLIGGLSPGAGNTIAFNANNGVVINCPVLNGVVTCGVGNQILSNSIYSHNNNLGIRFNSNGTNFGNNNQASPSLFFVGANGANTNFAGKLTSTANSNFQIQVFSNDSCNPTGSGEGQRLVGTTTSASDGSGVATFSLTGSAQIGEFITATATDTSTNNTSRFSTCVQAVAYQPGVLQFSLPTFAVSEGVGNALVTVARSGDNSVTATVNYATSDGSAIAGPDYTATSGTLSFAPGDNFKTFVVPIMDDSVVEPVEALNLTLSNPSSGSILGAQITATLSIADNDPAPVAGANGKIAFGRRINNVGGYEIFVMNQDGSNAVNVTNNAADDQQPAWSPDGTKLAFMSTRTLGQYQVFKMNADGTNVVQISDNSMPHYTPTWSPDGSRLLFEGDNGDFYLANPDGTNLMRLTNSPEIEANTDWSPDGTKILFTKIPTTGGTSTYELYVMNADGTNPVQLTNNTAYDDWGQWSPDGTRIVFQTNRGSLASEVYVMNADGSNPTNLSNTEATEGTPSWSSDGTKIVFHTNRDGNSEIYSMNADGSGVTRLTTTPSDSESFARWQPVRQNQTITFDPLANRTYGNAPFTVSATASSSLPVTFSVVSGPATISGNTVTITGGGSVTLRASQAGNATYNPASADQTFSVAKAPLSVIADHKTRFYGAPDPTFTVAFMGFLNGDTLVSLSGALASTTSATQSSPLGTYSITPGGLTSNSYNINFINGTLTVNKASSSTTSPNYTLAGPGIVNLLAHVTANGPSTIILTEPSSVTFTIKLGASTVGTVGPVALTNGQAAGTFNATANGAYTIFASFSGTPSIQGSAAQASLVVGSNINPVPTLSSLSPASAQKGSASLPLTTYGAGFVSNSAAQWFDPDTATTTTLATVFVSDTELQATVPSGLLAASGTFEIRVTSPALSGGGGGSSNAQTFFVTETAAPVTAASTAVADPSTGIASAAATSPMGGTVSAAAATSAGAGSGGLTVAQYAADPIGPVPGAGASNTFSSAGQYFDVRVASGSSFDSLTFVYADSGGTAIYWWTGTSWQLASNQSYNPVTNSITVTVNATTSPTIAQLTGTAFAVAGGPTVASVLTTPGTPIKVGATTPVTLAASFIDAGRANGDIYTATVEWGDGQTTTGNATAPTTNAAGSVSATHNYAAVGLYFVKLKITRTRGSSAAFGSASADQPVVVYDPNGPSLNGEGWFTSPRGAYEANHALSGKLTFGLEAKYERNSNVPKGELEFTFKTAGLEFESTSYQWLVVTSPRAKIRGLGTINHRGSYAFEVTVVDGHAIGGGNVDRLRLRVWNATTGAVVYDNQMNAAQDAAPTTAIVGGTIRIHKDNDNDEKGNNDQK
jgi:CSLREA domain-containing protein